MSTSFVALFQSLNQQLRERPTDELVLYFDDVEHFSCSQCGHCCQRPWLVGIDQAYYDRWVRYWNQHPDARFHGALRVQPLASFYATLKRAPQNGHCIFLEPDNACYIQRHLGAEAQPILCQQYPRAWARRHTGQVTLHLLESCYSAPLLLFGSHSIKWGWRPREADVTAKSHIELTATHQLTPAAFHLWQGWLLDQLSAPKAGISNALQRVIQGLGVLASQSVPVLDEPLLLNLLGEIPVSWPVDSQQQQLWQQQAAAMWGLPPDWQQVPAGWSVVERRLVAEWLQSYALRRLVVYGQWSEQPLTLVQEYTWLALGLLLLQLGLVQQQWQSNQPVLTPALLRDVLNQQEIKLFHSPGGINQMGLLEWDVATCLQDATSILGVDLTQGL